MNEMIYLQCLVTEIKEENDEKSIGSETFNEYFGY